MISVFCGIKHEHDHFCLLTLNNYLPFGALWTVIKHILILRVIIEHMYNPFKRVFFCFALHLWQSDDFHILSLALFTIILYFKYSHSNGWNLLPLLNLSILFRPFWFFCSHKILRLYRLFVALIMSVPGEDYLRNALN